MVVGLKCLKVHQPLFKFAYPVGGLMSKSFLCCVILFAVSFLSGCNMPVSYAWFCDPAYLAKKQQVAAVQSKAEKANWKIAERRERLRRGHGPYDKKAVDQDRSDRFVKKPSHHLKTTYLPTEKRKAKVVKVNHRQRVERQKRSQLKRRKLSALDGSISPEDGTLEAADKSREEKVENKLNDASPRLTLLRKVEEIQRPQSVTFDKKRLRFYVSRHGAKSADKKGAISLLARDGSLTDVNWVTGLGQPRGMAVVGDFLFVADGSSLVKIDIGKAVVVETYEIDGTFFFNDVAASSDGDVFVTDPLMNSIYKLRHSANENGVGREKNSLRVWLQSARLSGPNSLFVEGDQMFVGSIGLNKRDEVKGAAQVDDNAKDQPIGGLFKVDLNSKKIARLSQVSLPQLSSVVPDGEGSIYATTSGKANLLRFSISSGKLLESIDVARQFQLKSASSLGDIQYFSQSKEFWVPVKDNGHLLVFVRSDAVLLSEER